MISVGTRLKVVDNSGAKIVECIKVLGVGKRNYGYAGDIVVVSVKKINPLKNIKKGEILRGVIVSTKKSKMRFNGYYVSFGDNSVVIVNSKNLPIGTRVLSPVMLELRNKNFLKILSLALVAL